MTRDFDLLVPWFRVENPDRREEFLTCIQRNLEHPLIRRVWFFVEARSNEEERHLSRTPFLTHAKAALRVCRRSQPRRVSFGDMVGFANKELVGRNVIIANTDLFFDSTLALAAPLLQPKVVLALTRWNCGPYMDRRNRLWRRRNWSQDCWVLKPPLMCPNLTDLYLGWIACDNRLAGELIAAGCTVLNPSQEIRVWHLHRKTVQAQLYITNCHRGSGPEAFVDITPYTATQKVVAARGKSAG